MTIMNQAMSLICFPLQVLRYTSVQVPQMSAAGTTQQNISMRSSSRSWQLLCAFASACKAPKQSGSNGVADLTH